MYAAVIMINGSLVMDISFLLKLVNIRKVPCRSSKSIIVINF